MGFPIGRFGSANLPAVMAFMARFRADPSGGPPQAVAPVGIPPAGVNMVGLDRFHLASRNGNRSNADPFTQRPAALFYGGGPTTLPNSVLGGVRSVNIHPNPAAAALGQHNVTQEYGGATIYDGKLPMMQFWRAMPYARIPPKLPGLSTPPASLTASGFVDPHAIASRQIKGAVGGGVRWTP